MCGIAGIFRKQESAAISQETLKKMLGALRHRGPEETGLYLDDGVGLGHARLSIIDLAGGSQPIGNEDGRFWIVYNGEVFNYPELREELLARGHRFQTTTDTEVILHLYEEHGPRCLTRLNGQFALAIWDREKKELFLARDRVGILPLYFTEQGGRVLFASEIKAIFMDPAVERRLDPVALDQIFTFWSPLQGRSAFQGIREVPPGHYLMVTRGGLTLEKYWQPPFLPSGQCVDTSEEMLRTEIRELLTDAVRIRLRADVPVGCYLSGGMDSSGVTTLVKRNFNNHVRTFGLRFEEEPYDEGPHQQFMVSFLGTEHTEVLSRSAQIGSLWEEVLWHCETPLLRTAPAPLFQLSAAVRASGFKVVLTGEGADEVFGGYNIFREAKVRRFWARQPVSAWRAALIGRLYPYIFREKGKGAAFARAFFGKGFDQIDDPLFSHLVRWEATGRIKAFFSEGLRESIGKYSGYDDLRRRLPEDFLRWEPLARAQYLEMSVFLSNYLLSSQGDRMAMAHSVEMRPPFLDHRIIEYMGRVPARRKIPVLREKHLLKKVFEGILPEQVLNRPKHPYRAPIKESLWDAGTLGLRDLLGEEAIRDAGLFDPVRVGHFVKKLEKPGPLGEFDGMALAGILSAQSVHRQFVADFRGASMTAVEPDVFVDRRSGSHRADV